MKSINDTNEIKNFDDYVRKEAIESSAIQGNQGPSQLSIISPHGTFPETSAPVTQTVFNTTKLQTGSLTIPEANATASQESSNHEAKQEMDKLQDALF